MKTPLKSRIARGTIRHRRFHPFERIFKHSVVYAFIDLEEAPNLFRLPLLFTYDRPGLISFQSKNLYHGGNASEVKTALLDRVENELGFRPCGPIRVLTQLSYLGYGFNPVSFYYFYSEDEKLEAVLSEITNTPWGERHAYVIDLRTSPRAEFDKTFHVSPFLGMNYRYDWSFSQPENSLQIHMNNLANENRTKHFDATLALTLEPWNARNILAAVAAQPVMTFKTALLIYAHAALLWLRKTPFFDHPTPSTKPKENSYEKRA